MGIGLQHTLMQAVSCAHGGWNQQLLHTVYEYYSKGQECYTILCLHSNTANEYGSLRLYMHGLLIHQSVYIIDVLAIHTHWGGTGCMHVHGLRLSWKALSLQLLRALTVDPSFINWHGQLVTSCTLCGGLFEGAEQWKHCAFIYNQSHPQIIVVPKKK